MPVLVLLPLVGAAVVASMKSAPVVTVKFTALAFALAEFVIVVFLWLAYRSDLHPYAGMPTPTATPVIPVLQENFSFDWIPSFGIRFSLGVDGIALVMIALIALLVPIVLGASWEERLPEGRTIGGYFALILTMQAAMTGVFAATDVFLFYVMFEVMLIPMYFLIGAFGGPRRTYAATKFFLYSLLGGLLMLAGLIGLYVASGQVLPGGVGSLDFATLRSIAAQIPESTQLWIFAGFGIAFAIKAPLVPLHTWLPDAGAEAPAGAGTLLVGILDKVGTFGFLRICLPLLPAASARLSWLIITLAVLGIIYGAIVAAGQRDMKRFVTYTSIAHFGFICMGIFAFTTQSISGAVLYMVNHGIATALLFLLVGFLTARGGSRLISDYGGVWKVAPMLGGLLMLASIATIAVPGTNSFVSEFMVLIGTFTRYPVWATIGTTGIVLAAVYMLWVFQKMMTGPIRGAAVVDLGLAPVGSGAGAEPAGLVQPSVGGSAGQRDQHGGAPGDPSADVGAPEADAPHGDPLGVAVGGGVAGASPLGRPAAGAYPLDRPAVGASPSGRSAAAGTMTAAAPAAGVAMPVRRRFGDLNAREIGVLTPLVVLILFLGVYPQPVLDVINPTAGQTVVQSGHLDPAPIVTPGAAK